MNWPTSVELAGIAALVFVLVAIYRAHNGPDPVNLWDLLMENGKVSRIAFTFMGSWLALTYVFVATFITGKMTDTFFAAYGTICFAAIILRMFSPPSTTTVVSSSTSSTEVTQEQKP